MGFTRERKAFTFALHPKQNDKMDSRIWRNAPKCRERITVIDSIMIVLQTYRIKKEYKYIPCV